MILGMTDISVYVILVQNSWHDLRMHSSFGYSFFFSSEGSSDI